MLGTQNHAPPTPAPLHYLSLLCYASLSSWETAKTQRAGSSSHPRMPNIGVEGGRVGGRLSRHTAAELTSANSVLRDKDNWSNLEMFQGSA